MNCVYIDDNDVVCDKKRTSRWRVLAVGPNAPKLRAFMLVSLCSKHGKMTARFPAPPRPTVSEEKR